MIANIYSWIFPAVFFAAAGMYEFTLALFSWVKHRKDSSRRVVWFYILISASIGILTVSAFFVDWSQVEWNLYHLYFGVFFLVIFYFGFLFKFILGFPLVVLLAAVVLLFNLYFQEWNPIGRDNPVATFRVLSRNNDGVKLELKSPGLPLRFSEADSSSLDLSFEIIKVNKMLFLSKESFYSRIIPLSENSSENSLLDSLLSWTESASFLLSRRIYTVTIGKESLLYKYAVIIEPEENIYVVKFDDFFQ